MLEAQLSCSHNCQGVGSREHHDSLNRAAVLLDACARHQTLHGVREVPSQDLCLPATSGMRVKLNGPRSVSVFSEDGDTFIRQFRVRWQKTPS